MKPIQSSKFRSYQQIRPQWWNIVLALLLILALSLSSWLLYSTIELMPYFTGKQDQSENLLSLPNANENQKIIHLQTLTSNSQPQASTADEEPPFAPLINVIPVDGNTIFVSAYSPEVSEPINLDYNIGSGHGHYIDGFTMTYSDTTQSYVGVIEGNFSNSNTQGLISFSNTNDGGTVDSRTVEVQQTYVPLEGADVDVHSYDGNLELSIVNADTFSADTYIAITSSYMPPNTLSNEYTLLGAPYTVKASGAMSESDAIMLLNIAYDAQLLDGADPHSLTLVAWDAKKLRWHEIESKVFIQGQFVSASVTEFTTYALVATSRWQDNFGNFVGLDISTLDNLDSRSTEEGQELFIVDSPGSGSILSQPITPSGDFDIWGKLTFAGTVDSTDNLTNTLLSIDIMSEAGEPILSNVASGTDLAQLIDPQQHRSLRLRVNLTSTSAATSPSISSWQLSWISQVPLGDVNCDNSLTSADALFILQYTIQTRTDKDTCLPAYRELHMPSCDVNGDEACTGMDALFILQCDVGLANSLCPADSEFNQK